jgi:hypothetical protein
MPTKTKKRIQTNRGGDSKCKTSSVLRGTQMARYTSEKLRRVLENNKYLEAKTKSDQQEFMNVVIEEMMNKATKNISSRNPPYIKPSIDCLKCLNDSKLYEIIYDNLTAMNKKSRKEEVPASDAEIKIRVRAVVNFIIFVLAPALKKYKEETNKTSKTEEVLNKELSTILGGDFTLEGGRLDETTDAAKSLADEIFNNKGKIEEYYESEMNKILDKTSCNPNDEEDKLRCANQGKNPEFFLYLITGLFGFALIFEFAG